MTAKKKCWIGSFCTRCNRLLCRPPIEGLCAKCARQAGLDIPPYPPGIGATEKKEEGRHVCDRRDLDA